MRKRYMKFISVLIVTLMSGQAAWASEAKAEGTGASVVKDSAVEGASKAKETNINKTNENSSADSNTLTEESAKLKTYRSEAAKTKVIKILDEKLKAALNKALNKDVKSEITNEDMYKITELDISKEDISNLDGIEEAVNLTKITLNNKIKDLSSLVLIKNLKQVIFVNNDIGSVEVKDNSLTIINPLKNKDGSVIRPERISNDGNYDVKSNTIVWRNVSKLDKVSFSYNTPESKSGFEVIENLKVSESSSSSSDLFKDKKTEEVNGAKEAEKLAAETKAKEDEQAEADAKANLEKVNNNIKSIDLGGNSGNAKNKDLKKNVNTKAANLAVKKPNAVKAKPAAVVKKAANNKVKTGDASLVIPFAGTVLGLAGIVGARRKRRKKDNS